MAGLSRLIRLLPAALIAGLLLSPAARAQEFSTREGFTPDGAYRWQVELTPYLWLPSTSTTIGMRRERQPLTVNTPRPTVSELANALTAAFLGDGLVRYGPYSAELNVFYVAAKQDKADARLGGTLTQKASVVQVSPGFGYQLVPNEYGNVVAFDVRAGFSYFTATADADLSGYPGQGSATTTSWKPWLGFRAMIVPSPRWRVVWDMAATGLGVDNGTWGWNGRLMGSYLVTNWFDVSLGVAGTQTATHTREDALGRRRDVNFRAWGPVLAMGFRF